MINSFSIIIPGHYQNKSDEKTIDNLNKLLELKSLELHVEEVKKRGNEIKIADKNINYQTLIIKNMRYFKN